MEVAEIVLLVFCSILGLICLPMLFVLVCSFIDMVKDIWRRQRHPRVFTKPEREVEDWGGKIDLNPDATYYFNKLEGPAYFQIRGHKIRQWSEAEQFWQLYDAFDIPHHIYLINHDRAVRERREVERRAQDVNTVLEELKK